MNGNCEVGFVNINGSCVKRDCPIDGKHFCNPNDKPLKPPIARPGGKSQIAEKIIEQAPPILLMLSHLLVVGQYFLENP